MNRVAVINVVGLSGSVIGEHTPHIVAWCQGNYQRIQPAIPAVTTTAQTTYLTGQLPEKHGIVANGWKFRDEEEIKLWRQSNHLVQAESIWDIAKKQNPAFTAANVFWWYNMNSSVDFGVTPRPQYRANGDKIPDCYTTPAELRDELQRELGQFPLFKFWGPATDQSSSRWIAQSAMIIEKKYQPTLNLVYLPHLDYCLQKFGPDDARTHKDLREIDAMVLELIQFYEARDVEVLLLSEYGISPVNQVIHINRWLREHGWISIREEGGRELADIGRSKAFAMADHQIAHVYVQNQQDIEKLAGLLRQMSGVKAVYTGDQRSEIGLNHPRSGEIVLLAEQHAWFSYYYWLDDDKAPDFAKTVNIHAKPGYDPCEMLFDDNFMSGKVRAAYKLMLKKLGIKTTMDVISLDASRIKGSHGTLPNDDKYFPILTSSKPQKHNLQSTDIQSIILNKIFNS